MTDSCCDIPVEFTNKQLVRRPLAEVFDAVVNPEVLCTYFTHKSSGPLEAGATVTWTWSGGETAEVTVKEVIPGERIVCSWEAYLVDYHTTFTFTFEVVNEQSTRVTLHETGWTCDAVGLKSAFDQCEGWTNMLLTLKTRLEHNIDLRNDPRP